MGAQNALSLETDLMGKVTIQGAGAGKLETGFAYFGHPAVPPGG